LQLAAQATLAAVAGDQGDFLLLRSGRSLGVVRFWREADDSQRREMLTGTGGLVQRDGGFAFNYEPVKILRQQNRDRVGHRPDDSRLDLVDLVENSESAVLKDRVGI
jgi:hypothetical protein